MIVPADEAPMTNGSPYTVRQPPALTGAAVANFPSLEIPEPPGPVPTRDSFPATSEGRNERPDWRYLGLTSAPRQGVSASPPQGEIRSGGSVFLARRAADRLDHRRVGQGRRIAQRLTV